MSEFEEAVETKAIDPMEDITAAVDEGISFSGDEDDGDGDDYIKKQKKRRKRRIIIGAACLALLVGIAGCSIISHAIKSRSSDADMYMDAAVERRTISNIITGSSYIEPNDSYKVISMHSGDITADYISEGATVKKGDKLYQFDDEDARNQLTSARNNLTKAQQQYADAVKTKAQTVSSNNTQTRSARNAVERALNTLNDARDSLEDRYVVSDIYGKVSAVYVNEGDNVQNGMQLADVYDDSIMKLRLPFNEFDAANVYEGAAAEVSIAGSNETVWGSVTEVASSSTAAQAHTIVVYATIEIANPGALTTSDVGSAVVNDVACADTAYFEYADTRTITASASGTLQSFTIDVGDAVYEGQRIGYIDSDQLETAYDNARLSYDDALLSLERQVLNNDTYSQDSNIKNAQLSLEDARTQLKNAQKNVDDYLIEAPIDGTVVTKNAKAGDTLDSTNGAEPLCVIYDLSCVKFSIDVDETEIALVKVGQKATITADAVDGEFEGTVIKVPVDGVNQNGVTTYTIDIQIDNYGDLLPGMNIDAEIVVEEAQNVLAIPVNSVNRGNIVFVKDNGTRRANDVTDILSGEEDKMPKKDMSEREKDGKEPQNSTAPNGGSEGNAPQNSSTPNGGNAPQGGETAPNGGNGSAPNGETAPQSGGTAPNGGRPSQGNAINDLMANLPRNIEVPDGYRAIVVETGINDADYIEIKSGLNADDMVRTLNTQRSSADMSFGPEDMMRMRNMQGGMGGNMGGGMPGGNMGGGNRGGMGGNNGSAPGGGGMR